MRSEAIWIVQFLGSVVLLGAAFLAGLRVGRSRRQVDAATEWLSWEQGVPAATQHQPPRRDLFAPEMPAIRGELTRGS
jgi:hypothetical protein